MPAIERFGPTRRGGPLFRWLGEPLAIDLANTVMVVREGEAVDLLRGPADLGRWLAAEGDRVTGFAVDAEKDLAAVRELRDGVRELLAAGATGERPPAAAVEVVNEACAASPIAPRLAVDRDGTARVEVAQGGGIAGLRAAIARSAVELLAETPSGELRVCRAPSCGMFYLGARRWCCSACGNRARAARHYRRHRGEPASAGRGAGQ